MAAPVKLEIIGDASQLKAALAQSTSDLKGFSKEVSSISGGMGQLFSALKGPLMALGGVAALKTAFTMVVSETANVGDELIKTSQKVGVTVEALSRLKYAGGLADVTFEDLSTALAKLNRNMDEAAASKTGGAADAFRALGIKVVDTAGNLRDGDQVFADVAEKFSKMKDGAGKTALAMAIFGKAGASLIPLLNSGKQGLAEAADEAERLGVVISTKTAAAAEEFNDNLTRVDTMGRSATQALGNELIPIISAVAKNMVSGAKEGTGFTTMLQWLGNIIKAQVSGFYYWKAAIQAIALSIGTLVADVVGGIASLGSAAAKAMKGNFREALAEVKDGWARSKELWAENGRDIAASWKKAGDSAKEVWNPAEGPAAGPKKPGPPKPGAGGTPKENTFQAELNKLKAEGLKFQEQDTLAQKEAVEQAKAGLDLEEQRARYAKDKTLSAGQVATLRAEAEQQYIDKITALDVKYGKARVKLEEEVQAGLEQFQEASVERQIAAEERKFAKLEELAGRHLDRTELQQKLAAMKSADMLAKLKANPLAGTAKGGATAGAMEFVGNAKNTFQNWKNTVTGVLQDVQQTFAGVFQGILSGQMNFSQGLKAIWSSIASTIVGALAQMAAQWLVAAIANAIFGESAAKSAQTQAVASQQAAAAEIFQAHAYIPFVGPAIAAGLILAMNASLVANTVSAKGMTAFAQGGIIDRPTIGLLGEAGQRELAVPEVTFLGWADNLTRNLLRQERQVQGYQRQSSGYARAAAGAVQAGGGGPVYQDNRGAMFIGDTPEGLRKAQLALRRLQDGGDRR